jgi:hypothetical protein
MADVGYGPIPSNQILVAGNPLTQILKVETAADVYPGRLVKKGTNDDDVVVNTAAGAAVGWAGYEQTIKKHRPATVDTIYLVNAQIAVLHGGHFVIVATLQTGQTITKGALLAAGATGTVQAGTAGTHHIVAIAEESVTTTTSTSDIMVRSLL